MPKFKKTLTYSERFHMIKDLLTFPNSEVYETVTLNDTLQIVSNVDVDALQDEVLDWLEKRIEKRAPKDEWEEIPE
jgi:GTPase SAR1 family protein